MKEAARKKARKEGLSLQPRLPLGAIVRESMLDTVIVSGMAHVYDVLEKERARICGARYHHDAERMAHRAGHAPGALVLGGRRVTARRPRARTEDGHEVELPSWRAWSDEDPLHQRAIEQMVLGVSTRRYGRSLEAVPADVRARGTGRSAVSRRFVAGTQRKLDELMGRDLTALDLVVLLIDGVHFADHVVLVAVGVDAGGRKHVLGLHEGATENSTACKALLADLEQRGLPTDRAILAVIDGSQALRKAIRAVFGARALVQRCQEHKRRNVADELPLSARPSVRRAMNQAYKTRDPERAKRMLENLARSLSAQHPGAAASLREGLDETLTVLRLDLPEALERTLVTTNLIENLFSRVREIAHRVKRWAGGTMVLRWSAAGVLEAEPHFHRLRGHAGMPKLAAALRALEAKLDGGKASIDGVKKAA